MGDQDYDATLNLSADENLNYIDVNDPKQMGIYQRRMVSGDCLRLPPTATVSDELFHSFEHSFMQLQDDLGDKAKVFRYFWEPENVEITAASVPYGVAANVTHIVRLIESKRIQRDQIKVGNSEPSATTWDKVKKLTADKYTHVDIKVEDTTIAAAPKDVSKALDGIINFLTNDYYVTKAELNGGKPGEIAALYFADFTSNLKAMRGAYTEGYKFLPFDMINSFKSAMYSDYTKTLAAVRRRYGRCKSQDTMMDLFRKLNKAFAEKTRHEFKIGNLRNILYKYYITENFPKCSDYENDQNVQNEPEGYSPIINTLLTYIIFEKSIDKNRWDQVQKEYHHSIDGKPSYRKWHENRPELYKIMDQEVKYTRSINNVSQGHDEIAAVQNRRQNTRQAQPRQRFQPGWNQPQRRQNLNNNLSAAKKNPNDVRKRLQSMLCRHCSKWAGENRYHTGAKGGDPNSACPYDQNGNKRPNKKFVQRIAGLEVAEVGVEDFRCNDTDDDLELYEPDIDQVEPTDDQPIEPYCT